MNQWVKLTRYISFFVKSAFQKNRKRLKLNPFHLSINRKLNIDQNLNIRLETLKLLEENGEKTRSDWHRQAVVVVLGKTPKS